MSKPKILKLFDENVEGSIYSKLNNPVTVTLTNRSLVVSGVVDVQDNSILTFKPGCSCTEVDSITINSKVYTIKDSSGNIVTGNSDTWSDGAVISVALDTADREAYILSSNFKTIGDHVSNNNNPHNVTAGQLGALEKSGGTMTGDINMGNKSITSLKDPVNDYDATTKKYVDDLASKSDPYKLGDILTTVRTDLDESWALCNGDYVDESQPIYNLLPEIIYDSLENWFPVGDLNDSYTILQVIDQYYLVSYKSDSVSASTTHYYIIKSLYSDSKKVTTKAGNVKVVKHNNKYLYYYSGSLRELNMSTGETTEYLSSIPTSYGTTLLSFNGNLLILCRDDVLSGTLEYQLDSTNNILYIEGLTKIVNGYIYTFSYIRNSSSSYTLNIYRYNNGEFNLVSSVGLTRQPAVKYFCYNNGKYYILWIYSNSVYMISSTDGLSFEFVGSVSLNSKYSGRSLLGVLGNNIIIRAHITNSSGTTDYTTRLDLIDFINSSEVAIDNNISDFVYSESNHTVTLKRSIYHKNSHILSDSNYVIYQTYYEGKNLPLISVSSNNNEYNYIKIGGNL